MMKINPASEKRVKEQNGFVNSRLAFPKGSGSPGPPAQGPRTGSCGFMLNAPPSPAFQGGDVKLLSYIWSKLNPTPLLMDPVCNSQGLFPKKILLDDVNLGNHKHTLFCGLCSNNLVF